ncbi:MAG: SDR family NAD(P)-dependent oxidoreductase, partial [Gammaproteobacteria bacterium]
MDTSRLEVHAIVTGGGRGIGAAIAERLDSLGARLTLMGRNRLPLEARCRELRQAQAITVDVTQEPGVN